MHDVKAGVVTVILKIIAKEHLLHVLGLGQDEVGIKDVPQRDHAKPEKSKSLMRTGMPQKRP